MNCNINKFSTNGELNEMPWFSYNIISYLLENNEDIWKLIKYDSSDALEQPNLTLDEKRALIYKGEEDSVPFRVFSSGFYDDAIDVRQTQLRVYVLNINPDTNIFAEVTMCIEVIVHNKIMILNDSRSRAEVMMQNIIKELNGTEIGGIGRLYFNRRLSTFSKATMIPFNKFFRGYMIGMSNYAS